MTRLILKAIDFGASAVFMALCTKAFLWLPVQAAFNSTCSINVASSASAFELLTRF